MNRILPFVYGVAAYGMFLMLFLYLGAFVSDMTGAKTVSSASSVSAGAALVIDIGLITLFGLQHSVMARRRFKAWLTRFVPVAIERSTYVMATNLVLILIFAFWQAIPGVVWRIGQPLAAVGLHALAVVGWVLVLVATFLTSHFDLFGLRQVWLNLVRRTYSPVPFREILLYRWIRHPMMLGLLIAFWATPVMTASHALFSLGMSVYILIGIHFEERGLQAELGATYRDYVGRTSRMLPFY